MLACAITEGTDVVTVSRVRVSLIGAASILPGRVKRLAHVHAVDTIVCEDNLRRHLDGIAMVMPMTLRQAKEQIVGRANASHQELYQRLIATFPSLRRFVTILPTRKVGMSSPWRTVALIAVAISLTAKRPIH